MDKPTNESSHFERRLNNTNLNPDYQAETAENTLAGAIYLVKLNTVPFVCYNGRLREVIVTSYERGFPPQTPYSVVFSPPSANPHLKPIAGRLRDYLIDRFGYPPNTKVTMRIGYLWAIEFTIEFNLETDKKVTSSDPSAHGDALCDRLLNPS